MRSVAADPSELVEAIAECMALRGLAKSPAVIRSTFAAHEGGDDRALIAGLRSLGIAAEWTRQVRVPADVLPAVARLADGGAAVLLAIEDETSTLRRPGVHETERRPLDDVTALLLIAPAAARDRRADALVEQTQTGWFWPALWSYRRYFYEAATLSAVVNLLTLAGTIFMMTVYDRILPNQAYVTLWSLAIGVGIAMVFEFVSRTIRSHVLDSAGKKIDLILADRVFGHVLATRLEHRGRSSGAFANVLKEFESVRAFVTSASLTAVADLPFALLFLAVMALIAGPLALVSVAAFVIVAALALAIQIPLARVANEALREGAARHGTVVESLESIETIKAVGAEARMRRRHEAASASIAESSLRSQALSNLALNITMLVQQVAGAGLLVWGVYLASAGAVTAGALVACVQLGSRALAPLASLTGLAVRFQQARTALASLNRIMALPVEREAGRDYLSAADWQGELEMREIVFGYEPDAPPVLSGVAIHIRPGERVAILGRMGSGKSTLLRLIAGLYRPTGGQVLLDGVDLATIEPADVRACVALVGQDARLFHGSLRENLRVSAPQATDADLLTVARATGVAAVAAAHPQGFERPIGERGDTLSGGQRQAVALGRALLAKPKVMLLDEPTAAMDQRSEAEVLAALRTLPRSVSLVIVTHKQTILPLVDRIIVLDGGRIVADGPREDVLKALGDGRVRAVA